MANRLYNKQVSPKGYQKGGSVKQGPMAVSYTHLTLPTIYSV